MPMPFTYNKENLEQKTREQEKHPFWRSLGHFIWETLKVVIISLAIVIPVRYFIIQPFYVKGASMEPSFYDYEYLIIDEISYRFKKPERGEVVIFKSPQNPRQYFIKRIIALPEEKIKIINRKIIIYNKEYPNGVELNETKYLPLIKIQGTLGQIETTLRDNEYFVLGDNRNSSLDSRSFGPITRDKIMGRAWFRGWPFDRFGLLKTPEYDL